MLKILIGGIVSDALIDDKAFRCGLKFNKLLTIFEPSLIFTSLIPRRIAVMYEKITDAEASSLTTLGHLPQDGEKVQNTLFLSYP